MDPEPAPRVVVDLSAPGAAYRLLTSIVVPRPIAWVSTVSATGDDNLAPHSFYTVVSDAPPIVSFTSMGEKDTLRNVRQTREFVINTTTADLAERVNLTAVPFPSAESEFDAVGIAREPSLTVAPPRVAAAPCVLECRLVDTVSVGRGVLVLGEVTCVAVHERVLVGDTVDIERMDPIARIGGHGWSRIGDRMTIRRLSHEEFVSLDSQEDGR